MAMFKVRRIRDTDAPAVIALLNFSFPHVGMTLERLEERIARGARFVVAEADGEIIGFADLGIGRLALLRGIAVSGKWRGKGVGSALVGKAVKEAKLAGKTKVWLRVRISNAEAVRLYKGCGFSIKMDSVDRSGERTYVMVKQLEN